MAMGNMYRKFNEIGKCGFDIREQTDRQTDTPITILRTHTERGAK